jgi:hypothetical protein
MRKFKNSKIADIFAAYPAPMRKKLLFLRQLVFDTAAQLEDVGEVEETTKWGEPSYVTRTGSTIRMDWKPSAPDQYAMYFHCQSKLVNTFKELYRDTFTYQGNRAIVFDKQDQVPVEELKHCIALALTYQRRKHLPLLGV